MAAVAYLVVSATLVARTVTIWVALKEVGAVYSPPVVMDPAPVAGLRLQATVVFVAPDTEAVNCHVCPALKVTLVGLTETATVG
jgi:hypothetical protein